ncbi:hypothetical protein BTN33_01380 [Aeromonas veronii]|uniref:hypothetical protein n=1 Tax=Aeromonas veronii TaxID=654 RepID=UPI00094692E5|nr:hypothetical protein [Aeromonas veronii]OLF60229.1 hypothetical protein BTN33_01380 [Aeromonas veronii]
MMITVDFSKQDSTLFSGRKNGERARHNLMKKTGEAFDDQRMNFLSREGQLITSSYFLGLLGEYLHQFNNMNDVFNYIDLNGLDRRSKEECIRALRRGATRSEDIF